MMNKYMVFVCGPQPMKGMMEYYLDRLMVIDASSEEMAKTKYTVELSGWLRRNEVGHLTAIKTESGTPYQAKAQAREYMKSKGWT